MSQTEDGCMWRLAALRCTAVSSMQDMQISWLLIIKHAQQMVARAGAGGNRRTAWAT